MKRNPKPWLICPSCKEELVKIKNEKISFLGGIGLGCFTEVALMVVALILTAIVWNLDFGTAYLIAIFVVVLNSIYILHNHFTYYRCNNCNYTYELRTLKKKYNKANQH